MRTQFKKLFETMRLIIASILLVLVSVFFTQGTIFASSQNKDDISRGEFIKMLAQKNADNPLLPSNHSQLSPEPLYTQIAKALNARGINVLVNKSSDEPLSQQEFVRIAYAFAGGQLNKSLFEQKLFLKNSGIVSSTDIGITTGVDGNVYQTHKGKSARKKTELAAPIFMDDQFETGENSSAIFTFDDQSTLTMSEDTVININAHVFNPDKNLRETLIKASLGWVRFKVTKDMTNGSSFKVVTPTATAGVRGTEFVVITNPNGESTFVVLEGKIETFSNKTQGKGKKFFISAGEVQDFSKDGFPSAVRVAPRDFLAKVVNKTTKPKVLLAAQGVSKGSAKVASKKVGKGLAKAEGKKDKKNKTVKKDKVQNKAVAKNKDSVKNKDKLLTKGSAKNSTKIAVKGSAKGAAKDSAKKVAKGSAKKAAKDSAKKAAKGSAKKVAKDSAKKAAKGSAKKAAKDSAKSAAKNSAKSAAKDSAKSAAKDSAKETAKQVAKENSKKGKGKKKS